MRLVDSTGAAFGTLGNPLSANITGAGSGGTSAVDEAGFTAGVSAFTPSGGVFNDSVAALTSGQMGTQRLTANRAGHVNLRDSSGNELTPATISSANSSTTPLAGAAAFTGTGEDVSRYGSVQVSVLADQSSASNGLSLQWSSDNSHWDVTEVFSVVASQAMSVRAGIKGRFFRVVYTNGATLQTAFRLQTIYQTASAAGTATSTLGAFMGPTPGAQFSISMPYTFDSSSSTWGPVSGAKNLTGGIAGGALPAAAAMVFNSGDSKYYPALSAAGGGGTTGIGLLGTGPLLLAVAHGSNPTTVTAGQYVSRLTNRAGLPFTMGGHPNIQTVRANYTTAQTNTVVVANSAGTKLVVVGFMVTVDNAATANVQARLGLAAATTPTTTQVFGSHPGIAPGSGFARGAGAGMLAVGADGDQVLITSGVPTGGSIDVVVEYYTVVS